MRKSKYTNIITKEFLIKEYVKNKKSTCQIAKEIGCSWSTVLNYFIKYNIYSRTKSEARRCSKVIPPTITSKYKTVLTKNILIKYYIVEKKDASWIAKRFKCSKGTVYYNLKKSNIKMRTISEAAALNYFQNPKRSQSIVKYNQHRVITQDSRQKISEFMKGRYKGKNNPRYGKKAAHGKGSYYKQSWMRSTWETAYAKYCIKNHIKYRYEPEAFEITYKYKGEKKEGTYRPDFYLPATNEYIEIKGYWRDDAKVKFNAFKRQYKDIKIEILLKNDLKSMEVL